MYSARVLPPLNIFADRFGPIRYFLAPMAGITDVVFRLLMRELGAQIVVSELISAEGIVRGGQKTRDLIAFSPQESPFGVQLFGSKVESLVEASKVVQGMGVDFVDINFGCPVKKVVCDGGGSAWLKDPIALSKLLKELRSVLRIPLSIKVRTGWDDQSKNLAEVVQVAAESGVDWVAVHGRTRAQGYSGLADWELIRSVSVHSPIPIIGNGDILDAETARGRLNDGYCHAVMIGRGALKSPWIFGQALGLTHEQTKPSILEIISRHFELALQWKGRRRAFLSLKKFIGWYAAGYPGSGQFRARIFSTDDVDELKQITLEFFNNLEFTSRLDSGNFLMGGHG